MAKLATEQLQVALKSLDRLWKQPRRCEVCHQNSWTITDRLFEVREFDGGSLNLGGDLMPLLAVVCTTCGHAIFFNAIVLGIQPGRKEPATVSTADAVSHDLDLGK